MSLKKYGYLEPFPDILNFHIAENRDGTYGVSSGSLISYILTNLIVVVVLLKFIISDNEFINTKIRIFASLIVAGGISNCIDKIFRGYVLEFIDFKYLPVLNLADIFIIVGWFAFLLIFISFAITEMRTNAKKRLEKKS